MQAMDERWRCTLIRRSIIQSRECFRYYPIDKIIAYESAF
jgi:hypothetical protein